MRSVVNCGKYRCLDRCIQDQLRGGRLFVVGSEDRRNECFDVFGRGCVFFSPLLKDDGLDVLTLPFRGIGETRMGKTRWFCWDFC